MKLKLLRPFYNVIIFSLDLLVGKHFVKLFTVYPIIVTLSFANYCCELTIFLQDFRIYIVYFLFHSFVDFLHNLWKYRDIFKIIVDTHLMCKMNYKSRRSSICFVMVILHIYLK